MSLWLQLLCLSQSYCVCGRHRELIKHLAKLTDNSQVPMAQASILWLSSEYYEPVPKIAPDDPSKMAKPFTAEDAIHLATELYLINAKQTKLLTQYMLSRAKYHQNCDNHAYFSQQLIIPSDKEKAQPQMRAAGPQPQS